jgi:hypothetical protein
MILGSVNRYTLSGKDIRNKQITYVRKIVDDEVWLEGEQRDTTVDSSDVQLRVCQIVQETGADMRARAIRELQDERQVAGEDDPSEFQNMAM